jgi:hypothetical protein
MTDFYSLMKQNINIMNELHGFDVLMVCCSSSAQARYWQNRLQSGRGSVISKDCIVLAVEEDWPGGAGNGNFYMSFVYIRLTYFYRIHH